MTLTLKRLTHSQIHPNPLNPRRDIDTTDPKFLALVESIHAQGLLEPILVQKNDDGFVLVAGERRWTAIGTLIESGRCDPEWPIDTLIQPQHTDGDVVAQMLVENLQRSDLTPVEEMDGFVRLSAEYGWTTKEISAQTGVPESTVKSRVSWVKLPDHIVKRIGDGTMAITVANDLAALSADAINELCKNNKIPGPWDITNLKDKRKRESLAKKLTKRVRDAGHIVVTKAELAAPDAATKKALKKLDDAVAKDENLGKTTVRVREDDLNAYLVGLKPGQVFLLEDITYYVTLVHQTVAPKKRIGWSGTSTIEQIKAAPDDTTADEPEAVAFNERPSVKAYHEAVHAHEAKITEYNAQVEDARRTFVTEGRTPDLIAAVLRWVITEDLVMEGVDSARITEVLKLEIAGPADDDDEAHDNIDEWDAFAAAFAEYASKSAANLARAAAAALSFSQYDQLTPPGIEHPGPYPTRAQFEHLDAPAEPAGDHVDDVELADGEAEAIEQVEREAAEALRVADEERDG